jgi:hypothetical protein
MLLLVAEVAAALLLLATWPHSVQFLAADAAGLHRDRRV